MEKETHLRDTVGLSDGKSEMTIMPWDESGLA